MPIRNPSFKTTVNQTVVNNSTTNTVQFDPVTLALSTDAINDNDELLIIQSNNFKRIKASAIKTYNPAGSGGTGGSSTGLNATNILFLIRGTGSNGANNFVDSSTYANTIQVDGNTQVSTAQNPFNNGQGSIYFDGIGDALSTNNNNFAVGTGNFCFDFWVNWQQLGGDLGLFQISDAVGGIKPSYNNSLGILHTMASGQYRWGFFANNTFYIASGAGSVISLSTWYYVGFKRNNGITSLWVNGQEILSIGDTTNYTCKYLALGGYYSAQYLGRFFLSNFRYSNVNVDVSTIPSGNF